MKRITSIVLILTMLSNLFAPILVYAAGDIDLSVCSTSNYKVSVVSSANNTDLGCYSSYSSAKSAMLSYGSDANNVAVIYNGGRIINATYAIAKLDIKSTSSATTYIYPSLTSTSKYTSVAGYYGSDAAFIDYDESGSYKRAKVMISGYTGWINIDELNIVPLSLISAKTVTLITTGNVKLRASYSTSSAALDSITPGSTMAYYGTPVSAEGYLWYNVTYHNKTGWMASGDGWTTTGDGAGLLTYYIAYAGTGNLLHYFDTREWGQTFTNLATFPGFMTSGGKYYSFDGNYFYRDVIAMLNDYRNGTYSNSINVNTPYFSYFQYLPTRTKTGYTAADFNKIITDKGFNAKPDPAINYYDVNNGSKLINPIPSNLSVLYDTGDLFINGQNNYGTNALLAFSAALNESGNGTNNISFVKNNIFSVGAYDSCAFTCATTYPSVEAAIVAYMSGGIATNYANPSGQYYYGSHYGNKASGRNVNYATDPYWGEKAAAGYAKIDRGLLWKEFNSARLGIKQTNADVSVQSGPSTTSTKLYSLKNAYSDKLVSNMSVIILDSVRGEMVNGSDIWYKIQSDAALDALGNVVTDVYNYNYSVGYVPASYIYSVKDNAPIINAVDRVAMIGEPFDLTTGITAMDTEDGNITSFMTITGTVDFNTVGSYPVTYQVSDTSGNTVTKSITVIVTNQYQIKAGNFYLDTLDWNDTDKTLNIVGSLTMKDMNNDLNTNIKYELVFTNQNTGSVITKPVSRLTDETEFPLSIVGENGYTYKYSWFKDSISLIDIPSGDYSAKIVAKADANKTEMPFTNTFNKGIDSKATEGSRGYYFRVDKSSFVAPIDFIIRENGLISSVVPPTKNNMSVDYYSIGLADNKLNIRGTAYSIKGDYSSSVNVERKIILENINTFARTEQDVGYIDNGNYQVALVVDDGLSKQRAWYDGSIDISSLVVGRYAIYIESKAGTVDDYGELTDIFSRALTQVLDLGDKTAKLELNKTIRRRIELVIEAK